MDSGAQHRVHIALVESISRPVPMSKPDGSSLYGPKKTQPFRFAAARSARSSMRSRRPERLILPSTPPCLGTVRRFIGIAAPRAAVILDIPPDNQRHGYGCQRVPCSAHLMPRNCPTTQPVVSHVASSIEYPNPTQLSTTILQRRPQKPQIMLSSALMQSVGPLGLGGKYVRRPLLEGVGL
jgi:hypothetical protein